MATPPDTQETQPTSGSIGGNPDRLVTHLARGETGELINLLRPSVVEFLEKQGPEATNPEGLAYYIQHVYGKRGVLKTKAIRNLLLSKLEKDEAIELCNMLQLPTISPLLTLRDTDFDAVPGNLDPLERWYGVANDDYEAQPQISEGSHKAIASHKLHPHQLNAYRQLRRVIAKPPCSVLVHMPFGAGKLRLVTTAVLELYRSETDDKSLVWLAPGKAMCEEAFIELRDVWRQLGSRDTTILQLYGDYPMRDLDQLRGAIAVIDILRLSKEEQALETLGSFTSVAVLADAENLIHPVGTEIIQRLSAGGQVSIVGILAVSGDAIPEDSTRRALKAAFPAPCITVMTDAELQSLRDSRNFVDIVPLVENVTTTSCSPPTNDDIDFEDSYTDELSNCVERNMRLLDVLKSESTGNKGRIIFYATTAEDARLFAGLLPVQGVKARSVTAEDSPAERNLIIQRFVAREERVLCVHGFLLSGIAIPEISTCVMAQPCKSRAVFLATLGRLVQARPAEMAPLKLIVAADSQADSDWVVSLNTWSTLNT